MLLDFGAARLVLADRTQNVTAILKRQIAPIEQYAGTQWMRQGSWTDLFALASTCYFMLSGRAPLLATARVMDDELAPLARLASPGCSPRLLQILDSRWRCARRIGRSRWGNSAPRFVRLLSLHSCPWRYSV